MEWNEFSTYHIKRLALNEIEYGVILAILKGQESRFWHFGKPGACAVQTPGRAIVLGSMNERQCRELAEQTVALDYPGIIGSGLTPHSFPTPPSQPRA